MKKILMIVFIMFIFAGQAVYAGETEIKYLSGADKDGDVMWDFFCTRGRNSGTWTKIKVPSNWELQGFGNYSYGYSEEDAEEKGLYKCSFNADEAWKNKKIFIVFEGAMTDTEVSINGRSAGPVHQGAFYRFKYDITQLVTYDSGNILEVKVSKVSSNLSVTEAERKADYWVFGGIYRPVYLEIKPETYIDRVAIDAKADGSFTAHVYAMNAKKGQAIRAEVIDNDGKSIYTAPAVIADGSDRMLKVRGKCPAPKLWNAENPQIYRMRVSLLDKNNEIHMLRQNFGFRTVEIRQKDGVYINGRKIIFRGINRHSAWPDSGRCTSAEISRLDIGLIKDMNMNAVRMSHYPPDSHFLDLCDELGLYVIDELAGWQHKYDTVTAKKLAKEMLERDVNHPSIIFWANGNEGGWNTDIDADFTELDPQKRPVIHPWEKFGGINTKHYPDHKYIRDTANREDLIYMTTEFNHGLYDGGHGAALEDFWGLMMENPRCAGGFLWALIDEGILRTDRNNEVDANKSYYPDGILGPYREKEASFHAVKELWSPVYINMERLPEDFTGTIEVENRYAFTDLAECRFSWELASEEQESVTGEIKGFSLAPGKKGKIRIKLPPEWKKAGVLYLEAADPRGREIFTWSWPVKKPAEPAVNAGTGKTEAGGEWFSFVVKAAGIKYYFNKDTGLMEKIYNGKADISLSGPVQAGIRHTLREFRHYSEGENYIVEPVYEGPTGFTVKWTFAAGAQAKLEYSYSTPEEFDFAGITFSYPEEKLTGMKWLGYGPYRVWKNRQKGQRFGIWQKDYNDTVTGESWIYPEFKGYHKDVRRVTVRNKEADFTVYAGKEGMYLQMLRPRKTQYEANKKMNPPFPDGDIGFLDAISPIGTKFQKAEELGPQGEKNTAAKNAVFYGKLYFDFNLE